MSAYSKHPMLTDGCLTPGRSVKVDVRVLHVRSSFLSTIAAVSDCCKDPRATSMVFNIPATSWWHTKCVISAFVAAPFVDRLLCISTMWNWPRKKYSLRLEINSSLTRSPGQKHPDCYPATLNVS